MGHKSRLRGPANVSSAVPSVADMVEARGRAAPAGKCAGWDRSRRLLVADEQHERRDALRIRRHEKLNTQARRSSGTNPNDHERHWEANTQRTTNDHRKRRKQISIGSHCTPSHTVTPSSPHGHCPPPNDERSKKPSDKIADVFESGPCPNRNGPRLSL